MAVEWLDGETLLEAADRTAGARDDALTYTDVGADAAGTAVGLMPWVVEIPIVTVPTATAGSWTQVPNTGYIYNLNIYNTSHAQNDSMTWTKVPLAAGTWHVECLTDKGGDRAIQSWQLDGVEKATIDCYAAGPSYHTTLASGNFTVSTTGFYVPSVKAADKNASASTYYIMLQRAWFVRTA